MFQVGERLMRKNVFSLIDIKFHKFRSGETQAQTQCDDAACACPGYEIKLINNPHTRVGFPLREERSSKQSL